LTDPKSRKVIIIEHPLLPVYVKEIIAKVLFENLQVILSIVLFFLGLTPCQVPSISFASSHLLALLSVGRITGLVIDCGELETTALPVCSFPSCRFDFDVHADIFLPTAIPST
jgi:actin-related protein 10